MLRNALRATRVVLDGRNRFPIRVPMTQTRRRNDKKRLKIIQENATIIREGRRALLRRLERENTAVAATATQAQTQGQSAHQQVNTDVITNTTSTVDTSNTIPATPKQ